jgi:hypothetical protein
MFERFTETVRAELEKAAPAEAGVPPAAAPPIEVVSFGGQVLGRAALRALGQPAFWIVAALVSLAGWWLWTK